MIDFFTKQEKIVIIFLLLGLLIGAGLKILKIDLVSKPVTAEQDLDCLEQEILSKASEIDSNTALKNQQPLQLAEHEKLAVNVNTADFDKLILLPHVGPVMAKRIIDFRNKNGYFKRPEELTKIKGIGDKTFEEIKPFIIVDIKK